MMDMSNFIIIYQTIFSDHPDQKAPCLGSENQFKWEVKFSAVATAIYWQCDLGFVVARIELSGSADRA